MVATKTVLTGSNLNCSIERSYLCSEVNFSNFKYCFLIPVQRKQRKEYMVFSSLASRSDSFFTGNYQHIYRFTVILHKNNEKHKCLEPGFYC